MFLQKEFLTPPCTVFASRLVKPVPGTSLYMIKVTFTEEHAAILRAEMRAFLKATYGNLEGARALDPLHDLGDGQWLLDLVSTDVPIICDPAGQRCIVATMPRGSTVRVIGNFRAMPFPKIMPVMTAVQIGRLAQDNGRRVFEPFDLAA